jgi:hypothetical protein
MLLSESAGALDGSVQNIKNCQKVILENFFLALLPQTFSRVEPTFVQSAGTLYERVNQDVTLTEGMKDLGELRQCKTTHLPYQGWGTS